MSEGVQLRLANKGEPGLKGRPAGIAPSSSQGLS
jgi:hypothetical protein